MPDDALPRLRHLLDGVAVGAGPVGHHGRTLGSVAQVLVLSVVQLHGGLRRVAAIAVQVHRQLTVVDRQVLAVGQVLVQLVAGGADNLQRPVALQSLLHGAYRVDGRRTAYVARAVVAVGDAQWTLVDLAHQHFVLRQVLVVKALTVAEAVGHDDVAAVHTLPAAHGEGIALAVLMERHRAPHQLLT